MFFSPIQQLSQVFDSWQQTRVSVEPHRRADAAATRSRPSPTDPVAARRGARRARAASTCTSATRRPDAVPTERPRAGRLGAARAARRTPQAAGGAARPRPARRAPTRRSPWSARPAPASRPCSSCSPASTTPTPARSPSTGTTCAPSACTTSAAGSATCRRSRSSSPARIRDNIAYGRPDATDAEVEAAARAVGAHDFIASLHDGYLHPITERGTLALVRAAPADRARPGRARRPGACCSSTRRPPTSTSPPRRRCRPRWRPSPGRRTTILIAHRLQTARTADRIVVLGPGPRRRGRHARRAGRARRPVRRDVARLRAGLGLLTVA